MVSCYKTVRVPLLKAVVTDVLCLSLTITANLHLLTGSSGRAYAELRMDKVNILANECILDIIKRAILHRPTSILNSMHVCSRWRNIILGDGIFCARIAFECQTTDAIIQFLLWAGDVCQSLHLDNIMRRQTMTAADKARVVRVILGDTPRLQNAIQIISCITIPDSRWFTKLRSIRIFPHLKTLNVQLATLGKLPEIVAPNITSLSFATDKISIIRPEAFIRFLCGLKSLTSLSLRNVASYTVLSSVTRDTLSLTVGLPRLTQFTLTGALPSQYCVMRDLILPSSPAVNVTLDLIAPLPFQYLWPSVHIRDSPRLRVSLCPFHMGVKLIIEDQEITSDFHSLALETRVSAGPNHVDKIYLSLDLSNSDIIEDALVYADQIDTVCLTALYLSGHVLVPLEDDIIRHRIIPWLNLIPHPQNLVLDSILRALIQSGSEFFWPSLQSIEIRCAAHADTTDEDDQAAVDAVVHWLQTRTQAHAVMVELSGERRRPDTLSVTALRAAYEAFADNRT